MTGSVGSLRKHGIGLSTLSPSLKPLLTISRGVVHN